MSRERRLGRGLEALLGRSVDYGDGDGAGEAADGAMRTAPAVYEPHDAHRGVVDLGSDVTRSEDGQQWVDVHAIDRNPYQPRTHFDEAEIADLCDSIRAHGILQPIIVRRVEQRFQLVAGERRLRAAQMAGWERAPVQIRSVTDREMAELAIVENVQRKDLNAIEKARSFQRYLQEYQCTQEELASRVSIDRSTVANLIRLLELPEQVKTMVEQGAISAGHARALLPIGDADEQIQFAKRIEHDSMSVRATEQAVQEYIRQADGVGLSVIDAEGNRHAAPVQPGQHLRELEDGLRMALGAKVELKQTAKGRGRITIHFASHEEFDRLRALLLASGSGPSLAAGG